MARSLKYLFSHLKRYTLLIEGTGDKLRPQIILTEKEPWPLSGDVLDHRLWKARHVSLLATTEDRGTARIDFTARRVHSWAKSQQIYDIIESFNDSLERDAHWRFIRRRSLVPFLYTIVLFLLGVDLATNDSHETRTTGIFLLIASFIAALYLIIEYIITGPSAPLGVWPKRSTGVFRHPKMWIPRSLAISSESRRLLWTGAVTAIMGAILAHLLH